MKYLFFLLLSTHIFASSDFITPLEYASQLYKNPRGIGCQFCHGDNGKGRFVAKYKDKNITKVFAGSDIYKLSFRDFYYALNKKQKQMPKYFLTLKEIKMLYFYLHKDDKRRKKNDRKD